jgi:hypothetical protein
MGASKLSSGPSVITTAASTISTTATDTTSATVTTVLTEQAQISEETTSPPMLENVELMQIVRTDESLSALSQNVDLDSNNNDDTSHSAETIPEAALNTVDPSLYNGGVQLMYEQYDEFFPIKNGSISQTEIDDVYCLSFVMPNCVLRLSEASPVERTQLENNGMPMVYVREDPNGVYQGLRTDKKYYVYAFQDSVQLQLDQEATRARIADNLTSSGVSKDSGVHSEYYESCSCLFGNPCVSEYICKDWNNRYAIATKNGWKGF